MYRLVFLGALVCALLVSFGVRAESAWWKCTATMIVTYKDGKVTKGGASRELLAESEADAKSKVIAFWSTAATHALNPVKEKRVENVRCTKPEKSRKKLEQEKRAPIPPPLPPKTIIKPSDRLWKCRVQTSWRWGAKARKEDVSIEVEAPSDTAATGLAIMRVQARIRAVQGDKTGRNIAFVTTDAKCE